MVFVDHGFVCLELRGPSFRVLSLSGFGILGFTK